jgi:hypothetical protein
MSGFTVNLGNDIPRYNASDSRYPFSGGIMKRIIIHAVGEDPDV